MSSIEQPGWLSSAWTISDDSLVVAGVLGDRIDDPIDTVATQLQEIADRQVAEIRFDLDPPPETGRSAGEIAAQWSDAMDNMDRGPIDRGIRLRVRSTTPWDIDPLIRQLEAATGVDSIAFVAPQLPADRWFRWPPRIRFGPSLFGLQEISAYHHAELFDVGEDVHARDAAELLVVRDDELNALPDVRIGIAIVFRQSSLDVSVSAALDAAEQANAGAAALVAADPGWFLHEFLDAIAHNDTIDRAVSRATRAVDGRSVIVGHPTVFERFRVSAAIARTRWQLERARSEGHIDDFEFTAGLSALEPTSELSDEDYDAERRGATVGREAIEAAKPFTDRLPPQLGDRNSGDDGDERRLQAQVRVDTHPRRHTFQRNATNTIEARIGRSDLDWLSVAAPFPKVHPPRDHRLQQLAVYLAFRDEAAGLGVLGPVGIALPAVGESSVAVFEISIPGDIEHVAADISVWRGRSHLQTGVLTGPVGPDDDPTLGDLDLQLGDPSGADLDVRDDPDLALHLHGERLHVLGAKDPDAWVDFPGLRTWIDRLRERLFETSNDLDIDRLKLDSPDGLQLLRELAEMGAFLREQLFGDDKLEGVLTVETTSESSASFFPVEFLYEYGTPDADAEACPDFDGSTGPGCDGTEHSSPKYLCPSGFWALSKIIERQVRVTGGRPCAATEPGADFDRVSVSGGIVLAAADAVNDTDPDRITNMLTDLGEFTHRPTLHATSWSNWVEHVKTMSPVLLVALPHHVAPTGFGFPQLRISKDDDLALNRIGPAHVHPVDLATGPMLLLLGCSTASPDIAAHDFVRTLRCAGAAVVVATIADVLGQQAAPAAKRFVEAFWADPADRPLGEIMRSVRAQMIRDGNPFALTFVNYGSTQWRLTKEH